MSSPLAAALIAARHPDAWSSPLLQTLIGGVLAIVGGFLAAWWQVTRSDNVAQAIRRAERRESALIRLNAEVAAAVRDIMRLYSDARKLVLRSIRNRPHELADYEPAHRVVRELCSHWYDEASAVISDEVLVSAFDTFSTDWPR